MSVVLTSEPIKTIEGITSNVNASRAQIPYEFTCSNFAAENNYKVSITLWNALDDTQVFDLTFKYSPKPDGTLFLDLKQLITEWQEQTGEASVTFYLKFSDFETVETQTSTIQGVYSEKQILENGGSNVWNNLADLTHQGEQLTNFAMPRLWQRWKRTGGFIFDSGLLTRIPNGVNLVTEYLDTRMTVLATAVTTPIPTTVNTYDTILQDANTSGPPNTAYYRVAFRDATTQADVMQPKLYKIKRECDNPLFIEWLNSFGVYEQWIFDVGQSVRIDTEEGVRATKVRDQDIATIKQTKLRVADRWVQRVIVTAENVTLNELKGLIDIKRSSAVRILLDRAGNKFVQAVVSNIYFDEYATNDRLSTFTMELELPDNFDAFKAIDYSATPLSAHNRLAFTIGFN